MAGFDVSQEFTGALGADISSDEIVDGTIVNADINSSAGIDISKLNQVDIVTESEGIASNDTDLKIATCASIIDYVSGLGVGDVSKVGTPVDNQIGVWTGDGTLGKDDDQNANATFTFDGNDVIFFDATNDGNPEIRLGGADAEELHIQTVFDTGAQTLDYVLFQTDAASATANKGLFRFNVDGTDILDIDDGGIAGLSGITAAAGGLTINSATNGNITLDPGGSGVLTLNAGSGGVTISTDAGNSDIDLIPHGTGVVNLAASTDLAFNNVAILSDSAGTMTLSNVDALDATTESTIEAAIDTLVNLTSIQGNTFTLTGDFIRSGAHSLTLTTTGITDVTLPTSGTLVNSAVTALSSLGTVSTTLTGLLRADSGVLSVDTDITDLVSASSKTLAGKVELATTAEIDTGTDSTRAMPIDQFVASKRNVRHIQVVVLAAGTATAGDSATSLFEIESPIAGTITSVGAYNATAGTTGTATYDIHLNGTTIMTTTKISIETGEKSSRDATTQPVLTTTSIAVGDLLTFYCDTAQSGTPANGLTFFIDIRE